MNVEKEAIVCRKLKQLLLNLFMFGTTRNINLIWQFGELVASFIDFINVQKL